MHVHMKGSNLDRKDGEEKELIHEANSDANRNTFWNMSCMRVLTRMKPGTKSVNGSESEIYKFILLLFTASNATELG
jgi:hypothetical protein